MVQAGEGSGRLEEALDRVANQLERLDALRRQVRSAMMYPLGVLVIALLVMAAVCAFVVPVFTGIFIEIAADTPGTSSQLPLPTRITVAISDFITSKWYLLIADHRGNDLRVQPLEVAPSAAGCSGTR